MVQAHGLAAAIRDAKESETFDLGGQTAATITNVIETAFSEPFELNEMIRLTFVTGAGKQARAKYDDNAAKSVTSTLQKFGYIDDRGASCVVECAGSFKLQHDTGKNLKTVVVFPKIISIVVANQSNSVQGNDNNNNTASSSSSSSNRSPFFQGHPPEYQKICTCPTATFQNLITKMCSTWFQKKNCLQALEELQQIVDTCDQKLITGQVLTSHEEEFYNSLAIDISGKITFLKQQIQNQIEDTTNDTTLTKLELDFLKQQNADKIAKFKHDNNNNSKTIPPKLLQRKELLESKTPQPPPPLTHYVAIKRLQKELIPLLVLEESTKGRLLSIKETQTLARKDEIEQEIQDYQQRSRGWFESDESFQYRIELLEMEFQQAVSKQLKSNNNNNTKKKVSSTSATTTTSTANKGNSNKKSSGSVLNYTSSKAKDFDNTSSNNTKWVTPVGTNNSGGSSGGSWMGASTKKKKVKGKSAFSAMRIDDDSSDDDDDDDDDDVDDDNNNNNDDDDVKQDKAQPTQPYDKSTTAQQQQQDTNNNKKSKKKKKKKSNNNNNDNDKETELILARAIKESKTAIEESNRPPPPPPPPSSEKADSTAMTHVTYVVSQIWYILTIHVFPIIIAILKWIATKFVLLFFGKPKSNKKKQG